MTVKSDDTEIPFAYDNFGDDGELIFDDSHPLADETTDEPDADPDEPDDADEDSLPDDEPLDSQEHRPGERTLNRRTLGRATLTTLAAGLVLLSLLTPRDLSLLSPGSFARIPLEGLLLVALALVLPGRTGRILLALAGVLLGLLTIVKAIDTGSFAVIGRPFDLVLDWAFVPDGLDFLGTSLGRVGEIAVVIAVVALVVGIPTLTALSLLRVTRVIGRHRPAAVGTVATLGVVWVLCAVTGVQLVPNQTVAAKSVAVLAKSRATQVHTSLLDHQVFAKEAAVDKFKNTPGRDLLTGLRGKDVVLAFIESYGRSAVEDPSMAPSVDAVLDAGTRKLQAAGFASRSGYLTSPTAGGGSVLAHATLLSGLWINNRQRYHDVTTSDRLTLNQTFQRANWRSVAVVPGVTQTWAEGGFFGYDKIYAAKDLGYRGPKFSWAPTTDQYVLSAFERDEHSKPNHTPIMAEIPLVSSHLPWAPIPSMIDWKDVGDGSVYTAQKAAGQDPTDVWRDHDRIRTEYRRSIEYSLNTLISYVQTYGDDNLVMVFLGDHQPVELVSGKNPSHDVPITVVARDPAVLDQIADWNWTNGLRPDRKAPVWPMSDFRDRFLEAFGSTPTAGPTQ